ncbi:MAG: AIR synthase related protein [Eggerthella lenta]
MPSRRYHGERPCRDAIKDTRFHHRPVVGDISGFGGLFSIAAAKGSADPLLVSGTDGVEKLRCSASWRARYCGHDLVAMAERYSCHRRGAFVLPRLRGRGQADAEAMAKIVGGIGEGCRQSGCALIGGEMAEHPGDGSRRPRLSGFCVGLVDRCAC